MPSSPSSSSSLLIPLFLLLLLLLPFPPLLAQSEQLHPIFLVHGFIGSKLYVSGRNIHYPAQHKCTKNETEFHKAWVSKYRLARDPDCEFYWMGLDYNAVIGTFEDRPGLQVGFHDQTDSFGSVQPIQCLWWDGFYCSVPYFRPLVKWLEQIGYSQGENLFGAVYDWRHHPSSPKLDEYYGQLKAKIESAVNGNGGGKKAVLVAHSYGNIVINHFLAKWTNEDWRQNYVESTVNVAAPFGGSALTVHNFLLGGDQKFAWKTFLEASYVRDFVRSLASPAILMPRPGAFNSSHSFVEIANSHIGVDNMEALFRLANSPHLLPFYQSHAIGDNGNIPMHCVYGIGQKTQLQVRFERNEDFLAGSKPNEIIYGDGDGSVNIESLRMCQKWQEKNGRISWKEIPGEDHESVLGSKVFLDHLATILLGNPRNGEYFAVVEEPNRNGQQQATFANKGQLCIRPNMAKCSLGSQPSRWTRKKVQLACFDGQNVDGRETMENVRLRREKHGEEGMMGLKRGDVPMVVVEREEIVPLTCIPS